MSYGIVHEERGVWGGLTEKDRENLGPAVKESLIVEAKAQGWYENRVSIDELLRRHLPLPQSEYSEPDPPKEVVQVTVLQTVAIYLPPLEELLMEVPLPNVPYQTYEDSNEYLLTQTAI